ncbi:MAG: MBL fold metallo-hydrolase [Bacteroidales bacterium]|nr:MBL fold metallo-hydrolase [Bacteroidales bacterium]
MKIQFLGAVGEVTGSKFLITTNHGKKILLDCGMYQGKGLETDSMNRDLGFDPEEIDIILLSHAHIDHSGLIPYICKLGFKGKIYCTHATRDLCSIMLPDAGKIQESDIIDFNKKQASKGLPETLTVLATQLALVPSEGRYETLCHEFKCAAADGRHYIIYVNAQTGAQHKILILLEDESGALTL